MVQIPPLHGKKAPLYHSILYLPAQFSLMFANVRSCTGFPPTLASRLTLMVFDAQVFNTMGVHSSSTRLNNIRFFAPSVAPPALQCRNHTTCPIHPFGEGSCLFPPTYRTLPFAIFQKAYVYSGNLSDFFNTQSATQHY